MVDCNTRGAALCPIVTPPASRKIARESFIRSPFCVRAPPRFNSPYPERRSFTLNRGDRNPNMKPLKAVLLTLLAVVLIGAVAIGWLIHRGFRATTEPSAIE